MNKDANNLSNLKYLFLGIRHQANMNKAQFQEATNIHPSTATKLETGNQPPTLENLTRYANYLDCKVYELIQAVEESNHLTYLITVGKEVKDGKSLQKQLDIINAFNKLTPEEQQKFLENALQNL